MTWLAANWFWVLIFIAFIWMHIGGHGGHGGHGRRAPSNDKSDGGVDEQDSPTKTAGGHQH